MWNIFKKKANNNDPNKMGMLQRIAMKKLEKMSPVEKEKMAREAFKPENKDKILAVMEQMKKSGQVTDEQIEMAKKKLGI